VVVWDEEGDSFIYALDKNSGEVLWKKPRNERSSWSTPSIIEFEGQTQVVVNGTKAVRSYDLKSGDLIWECSGQTANAIPSPVHQDGIVIAMSGFRGNALHAIRLGHKGVLTGTDAVVWSHDRGTPYVPSPLLFDGKLWFCQKNDGILSCFGATSGEMFYSQERLGIRGVYASPIAAGNRVYIAGRDGNTVVVENSTQFKILKTNRLEEKFDASPVVVGDYLYLRGQNTLYCIGETEG
jgi:outer membrane protein assembly factor BamB